LSDRHGKTHQQDRRLSGDEVTQASVNNTQAGDAGAVNPTQRAPAAREQPSRFARKVGSGLSCARSGDCQTQVEKQANGVYRGGEVTQASEREHRARRRCRSRQATRKPAFAACEQRVRLRERFVLALRA